MMTASDLRSRKSTFPALLTAGMHGLSLAVRIAGRHLLRSLDCTFRRHQDRRSAARLLACPDRSRHSEAAFHSPATRTRFQAPISRSLFLAYFFPVRRTFTESAPVRRFRMPHRPPLPFGGFYTPPDLSVQPVQPSESPPAQDARFPFAPRSQTPYNDDGLGSTFQEVHVPSAAHRRHARPEPGSQDRRTTSASLPRLHLPAPPRSTFRSPSASLS